MADMQARLGPMRVGPHGLLQPIADAVKLLIKEDIIPGRTRTRLIFWFAPVISMVAALTAMGAMLLGPRSKLRAISTLASCSSSASARSVFSASCLAGGPPTATIRSSGAIRSTAQLVSYETAGGHCHCQRFASGGNVETFARIVDAQYDSRRVVCFSGARGLFHLCGGFHCRNEPRSLRSSRSGIRTGRRLHDGIQRLPLGLYFLGEYANMIVVGSVATTLFLGGWLRPFPNVHWLNWLDFLPAALHSASSVCIAFTGQGSSPCKFKLWFMWAVALACFAVARRSSPRLGLLAPLRFVLPGLNGAFWFLLKVSAYIYVFMWLRFTLPRYRFDQLMHLGWYILIPLAIVNVFAVGIGHVARVRVWLEPLARLDRHHGVHFG